MEKFEKLISDSESKEIASKNIDRVDDGKINSAEDISAFLEEQFTQATEMIDSQALDYFNVDDVNKLPKNIQDRILFIHETLRQIKSDLSSMTLRSLNYTCSQLTELVGGTFDINEEGRDQFGGDRRPQAPLYSDNRKDVIFGKSGHGYINYLAEGLGGKKMETNGAMNRAFNYFEMQKIQTNELMLSYIKQVINGTGSFKEIVLNPSGPTLLVLPEVHYDPNTIGDNLNTLMNIYPFVDISFSEGANGLMDYSEFSKDLQKNMGVSSEKAELLLGDKIDTFGIENLHLFTHVLKQNLGNVDGANKEEIKIKKQEIKAMYVGLIKKLRKNSQTIKSFFGVDPNNTKHNSYMGNDKINIAINARNTVWMQNASKRIIEKGRNSVYSSGIVTLGAGAAHVQGLPEKAKNVGFSRILIARSDGFDKKIDEIFLIKYAKLQLGIEITEEDLK